MTSTPARQIISRDPYFQNNRAAAARLPLPDQPESASTALSEPPPPVPKHQAEGSDLFPNAHDFVISNLNVGGAQLNQGTKVLKELQKHVIPGAEYNSAERDPPPRCHPGTRTAIREEFCARLKDASSQTRILWMHGPAGVGKSAIMQTLAEEMSPHVICSTLFFSRPNHRDDARKAFLTLAYRLAVANPSYQEYIGMRIKYDPLCLTKSLDDQFKTLFITPFVENHVDADSRRWIMFLDGLDECQNTENLDNQCRIINLIRDSTFHHAESTPFVWVIASRPEDNLKKAWSEIRELFEARASKLWEVIIPVDSDQAAQDVELYLHKEFETIRKRYSELMPVELRWPSDSDFLKVAKKSSGLFIFASTVIRYVSDEDPIFRLKFIIFAIDRMEHRSVTADESPFHLVDLLYSSIMSDIPKRLLPVVKSLLGLYHVSGAVHVSQSSQQSGKKISFVEACNILGLHQNEAYTALRRLQSVLTYPAPNAARENGILFFHTSFPDFLLDRSRSQVYHVDLDQELTGIWRRYVMIVKQSIGVQGQDGISISWPPGTDTPLLNELRRQLLSRAQKSWIEILITSFGPRSPTWRLLISVPELICVFENLGLAFLSGDQFPVEGFLSWLDEHASRAVQDRIIFQKRLLSQLNMERLFRSLCTTPRYRRSINSYVREVDVTADLRGLKPSQWARAKAVLWSPSGVLHRLVEASTERVKVTVVGIEASETCAIIGPIYATATHRDEKRFYIFPYSPV